MQSCFHSLTQFGEDEVIDLLMSPLILHTLNVQQPEYEVRHIQFGGPGKGNKITKLLLEKSS